MSNPNDGSKVQERDLFPVENAKLLFSIASLLFFAVLAVYFYWFWGAEAGGPAEWGQFGDYMGGVLNPILSLFAFLVLLFSLRASVKALRQNENILELTKVELEQTRIQIQNTESALKKQTDIVQANAYAERLGNYADRVYGEIQAALDTSKKNGARLLRVNPQEVVEMHIHHAFDIDHPDRNRVRANDDWAPGEKRKNVDEFVGKMIELSYFCRQAHHACQTTEMPAYYSGRLSRWAQGLVDSGYASRYQLQYLIGEPDNVVSK